MEFKDALEYVNQCVLKAEARHLRPVETEILRGAWDKLTYNQMAAHMAYSPNTLQKVYGYELWNLLRRIWSEPRVSKARFKEVVTERLQRQPFQVDRPSPHVGKGDLRASAYQFNRLGGLDTNPSLFPCRDRTLQHLSEQIRAGHRLVIITGASGIGKTVLVGALVGLLGQSFEDVLYRRVDEVPTLIDWYREFAALQPQVNPEPCNDEAACLRATLKALNQRRYLLVIDQTETFLPSGITDSTLTSSGYRRLLERVSQTVHRSCLVWVGQARPAFIAPAHGRVWVEPLSELAYADARTWVLDRYPLAGDIRDWQRLVALCGGNPKLLIEIAIHIVEMHNSQISSFLATPLPLPESLTAILSETIETFSEAEVALLYLLALHPMEISQLEQWRQFLPFSTRQLRLAWASLQHRHWLKADAAHPGGTVVYPPLSALYVLHRLADAFSQSILANNLDLCHRYPVQVVTAAHDHQTYLRQHLIAPIADDLWRDTQGSLELLRAKFARLLEQTRQSQRLSQSYTAGNLLNLASQLKLSLAGFDFSGLDIRQADLQTTDLRGTDFSNCKFHETIFASGLSSELVAAMHSEGQYLAIGDAGGRLNIYGQKEGQFLLLWSDRLEHSVQIIVFGQQGLLAVVTADQTVHVWWSVEARHPPDCCLAVEAPIRTLGVSPDATYLAVGLFDGRIVVHNLWQEKPMGELNAHRGIITHLAFSPGGQFLAGYSDSGGNQVWIWQVDTRALVQGIPLGGHGDGIFLALGWDRRPLVLERAQYKIWLRTSSSAAILLSEQDNHPASAAISTNGLYVASSSQAGVVKVWHCQSQNVVASISTDSLPGQLSLSNDGGWLLHNTATQVRIYEVTQGQCVQIFLPTIDLGLYDGCQLAQSEGISPEIRSIAQSLGATS